MWIAYNGEVYNHAACAASSRRAGHRYRTASDTETLVHAYEQWGPDFVRRAARHVRVRDLGPAAAGGCSWRATMSASSRCTGRARRRRVRAAHRRSRRCSRSPASRARRPEARGQHLTLRYAAAPRTLFDGIHKLPPGPLAHARGRRARSSSAGGRAALRAQAVARPRTTRWPRWSAASSASVQSHLMSDVPLGALLSGGVDSSLVVALMSRLGSTRPCRRSRSGFDAPGPYSELPFARHVSRHCRTEHREITVGRQRPAARTAVARLAPGRADVASRPRSPPTWCRGSRARPSPWCSPAKAATSCSPAIRSTPWSRGRAGWRRFRRRCARRSSSGVVDRLPFRVPEAPGRGAQRPLPRRARAAGGLVRGLRGPRARRSCWAGARPHAGARRGPVPATRWPTPSRGGPLDRMLDVDLRIWLRR